MRTNENTWDVSLAHAGNKKSGYPTRCINLPASLSRAMDKRGFNRVEITLTSEGLLLKPYSSEHPPTSHHEVTDLPF